MRALLAGTAISAAMSLPAAAQDATWSPPLGAGNLYNTGSNWSTGTVPGTSPTDVATFGASNATTVSLSGNTSIGGWTFSPGAPAYTFDINGNTLGFFGAGISNGGNVTININAGNGAVIFNNNSSADSATINNGGLLAFTTNSTAGSATITAQSGATTRFLTSSSGGTARFITQGTGTIDLSPLT